MSRSILLVDDDPAVLDLLTRFFRKRGWTVSRAVTGAGALEQYDRESPALVLLDLNLPDMSGLPVLQHLQERDPAVTVLMLTGHGDVPTAVEAMRLGAENFLPKPVDLAHLGAAVDRAAEKADLRRRNRMLAKASAGPAPAHDALGTSPLMRDVDERVSRIADAEGTVLLEGATGTGKGWIARLIHERSARRGGPFVEVGCAGLSAGYLDDELFGHERGATPDAATTKPGLFEVADGGTLFLDEVAELDPAIQPRLLEVLESRRFRRAGGTRAVAVDVRVIAATSRGLRAEVDAGRFRDDLYFRLAVLPLRLPPLRERTADDIATLAYRILADLRRATGLGPERIADDALDVLAHHVWPGNIRELRNVLERIVILADGADAIRSHHLPAEMRRGEDVAGPGEGLTLAEVERRHILRVLEANGGNRSRSARILGISRATLYEKLDRYGLRTVGQ